MTGSGARSFSSAWPCVRRCDCMSAESRRVALVTGGAIRVGKAIAMRLAQDGFDVAITYRTHDAEAVEVVAAMEALGVRAAALAVDLADADAASALPARVADVMGRLDVVVSSASGFYRTPVGGVAESEWDDLFAVNVKGPFFLAQAAVPYLKHEGAVIINITDTSVRRPFPGFIPYGASKAALDAVTIGLARALAPRVRVNAVAPGPVLPPEEYDEAANERAAATTLLQRWGSPEDVAAAVSFLVSSPYLTGVILPVDGGRGAKGP